MKILAVIPARGGSKGIPRKNIRIIGGKPLITYSIENAINSKYITDVIVTTDDDEIEVVARQAKANVLKRKVALADDITPLDPVIINAVEEYEVQNNIKIDYVITLQATSPLLKLSSIDNAIEYMLNHQPDTIISAVDDRHLSWKREDGKFSPKYKERVNRQYLPEEYRETGGFVITTRKQLETGTRIGLNTQLYVVKSEEAIDIDTDNDWVLAEHLLTQKTIVLRVDGYEKIGLGHIHRCLLLASNLTGHKVIFLMNEKYQMGIEKIQNSFFKVKTFKESEEFEELKKINPDIVINDILDTNIEYINNQRSVLSKNSKIINFEDNGTGSQKADIVFNALYEDRYNTLENHYYGKNYYCIREEFIYAPTKKISAKVNKVLLTYGGTDPNNFTKRVLKILINSMYDFEIEIVIGLGYQQQKELKKIIESSKRKIKIHHNVKSMSQLMLDADIIFSSAGRTMYEIASVGTPAIILCQNNREIKHVFGNHENGFINLGLGTLVSDKEIEETFEYIYQNIEQRQKMNSLMLKNELKKGIQNVLNLILK